MRVSGTPANLKGIELKTPQEIRDFCQWLSIHLAAKAA